MVREVLRMRRNLSLSSIGRRRTYNSSMDSTAPPFRALRRLAFVLAAACALPAIAFNHDRVVAPIAPGRLPVACSNVAQDVSRIAPGAMPSDYWDGKPVN